MKPSTLLNHCRIAVAALGLLLAMLPAHAAFTMNQTFNLRAGWNAIWLEVEPANEDINVVFQGVPVESVWTFASVVSAVDFIQDPSETVWNRDRWLVHLPTNRVASLNNNLFKILGNRAYLVKVSAPATLTVAGEPKLRFPKWAPDAYNFRGFPVDPNAPPTFANFFRFSPAHYNNTQQQLQKIYQLNSAGEWTLVNQFDRMKHGEAYWVYTAGVSDFNGPLGVSLESGNGLQFSSAVTDSTLHLQNVGSIVRTVTVSDIGPGGSLSYQLNTTPPSWAPLPRPLTQILGANSSYNLLLAANFSSTSATLYETIVRVTDGQGTMFNIPVDIGRTPLGVTGTPAQREAAGRAGLWVGTATINGVSEVHAGSLVTNIATNAVTGAITREVTRQGAGNNPTPTRSEFSLRLLLHVDTNGTVRLLKDVVQMWQEATYDFDQLGRRVQQTPGRYVLLTDERLIPQYKGAVLRDGEMVGRRLSTADFPFTSTPANNFLPLTGTFAVNNTVAGSYTLGANDAVNPFKHKYHPDHDNLDATFTSFRGEAYEFSRSFQMTFTPTNTVGVTPSDYGYTSLSGTYVETLRGLHRTDIVASGPFQLRRVISTPVLNQ
ncbi:MAG: hypothetical protein JNN07_06520 [Verrucomicrobiales bacterium]|nr:hypothetical protein [Verrucomicrobiales bacterium]